MAATEIAELCTSPHCNSYARLQCPTCLKLSITGSFFCSQECFKANWCEHKKIHKKSTPDNYKPPFNPWPGYVFTGDLRPFPVTGHREVPDTIPRPDYASHPEGEPTSEIQLRGMSVKILTDDEQELMRVAGKLGREVLDIGANTIDVGVTTDEIDRCIHEACIDRECYPSPLNYYKFPKSCCTSVNEVICHGIPDLRPLESGDIVNIDVTVYHQGFHSDLNETFFVGDVSDKKKDLVRVAYECLANAQAEIKPGVRYREMGNIIQKHAQANGCSVVRSYCGHGVNSLFHTTPSVPHYAKNKAIGIMKPGHTFTIEPMISEGSWRDKTWPDNWTSVTQDGKCSAQFEHTYLVTESGVEILTQRRTNKGQPHFMDQL